MDMYNPIMVQAIDKALQVPIHQQLEEMLMDEIASGRLKPGDKVYSENSVAQRFTVSRTTVRSVYDRLVVRGVLTRRAGKGTYVSPPPMTENISLLVGFSEKMTASGYTPVTQLLATERINATEEMARALRVSVGEQVVSVRRLRLLDSIPFVVHSAILPYPRFSGALEFDFTSERMTDYLQTATRFGVSHAEETVSAAPADDEDVRLLDIPKHFPVLVVCGTTYDNEGLPVRYSIARYHSTLVRLQTAQRSGATL